MSESWGVLVRTLSHLPIDANNVSAQPLTGVVDANAEYRSAPDHLLPGLYIGGSRAVRSGNVEGGMRCPATMRFRPTERRADLIDAFTAFDLLRRMSQESNIKLVDIAERIAQRDHADG